MPAATARAIAAWGDTLFVREYTAKGSMKQK